MTQQRPVAPAGDPISKMAMALFVLSLAALAAAVVVLVVANQVAGRVASRPATAEATAADSLAREVAALRESLAMERASR